MFIYIDIQIYQDKKNTDKTQWIKKYIKVDSADK